MEKKIKFVRVWYAKECTNLDFSDRLKLARVWIAICLKDEEYEMAAAIQNEKLKIVKKHIKEKRSKRSFSQKIYILFFILKRKIKAFLRNRQSK